MYKIMEWPDKELLINLQSLFFLINFYGKAGWRATGILEKAVSCGFNTKAWLE